MSRTVDGLRVVNSSRSTCATISRLTAAFFCVVVFAASAEPFSNRGPAFPVNESVPFQSSLLCHHADMGSTAIGLSVGLVEMNPLGPIGVGLAKIWSEVSADQAETKRECYLRKVQARTIGCGLAGWNLALAGAVTGGTGAAIAIGAAAVSGLSAGYAMQGQIKKDAFIECYFPGSSGDIQIVGAEF